MNFRCFATETTGLTDDAADVIVLEDKKPQGFAIVDIKTGLDAVQCRLVMEKVALLHAASIAMDILDPEQSKSFKGLIDMKLWTADVEKALSDLKKGFLTGLSKSTSIFKVAFLCSFVPTSVNKPKRIYD